MVAAETAGSLLDAATGLFASRGYAGVGVRQICAAAGASANAVHYHFGSKENLYRAVLQRFADERLASARRLLGEPPGNIADLVRRLRLFLDELLCAYLRDAELVHLVYAEMEHGFPRAGDDVARALFSLPTSLQTFLDAAAREGLLRPGSDVPLTAGMLIERCSNQARFASTIDRAYGVSVLNEDERRRWVRSTVEHTLFGIAANPQPKGDDSEG